MSKLQLAQSSVGRDSVEVSTEHKGASKCSEFFKTFSWKLKNSSTPLKVREVGRVRDPLGLTVSF